ncbi:hypothetical protein LI90_1275 [Carbonactinospora thermoautotrophica]|uniref:Secreted protein n=2 Tax=Carbonactinospora thermoautotrophica TaxID=1469144 RepID=A0A132MP50_9ACTN|nr:DUF3515 domain-containing protein [Carbonactinospora thermoautotrophica]KWW99636.1 hypothetical protein LI90_1275 [Carbonactinospora thermoautotrophica]
MSTRVRWVIAAVATATVLAALGLVLWQERPVRITVPAPPPADAARACAALHHALPRKLDGQDRRRVTTDSPLVAAWGDPPIVLRCGVPVPAAYQPTSQVVTINGVDWFPEQLTRGYVFTTVGRVANVEVSVPDAYAPEVNPLVDLAGAVADKVPKR